MIEVRLVVGPNNSRKSSLIRALTGGSGNKVVDVATRTGIERWLVRSSSINEHYQPPPKAWVKSLRKQLAKTKATRALIPIREFRNKPKRNAKDYHDALVADGIVPTWVLGMKKWPAWITKSPTRIELSIDRPSNAIAADVRRIWGWE